MTVQELRDTLTSLVRFLEATGAKATTTRGLTEFVELTKEFGDLNVKAFVKLAEVGRTPITEGSKVTPKKGGGGADTIAANVKSLYERAGERDVTEEGISAACEKLGTLSKEALVALSEAISLFGMKSKTKPKIVTEITNRVLDQKGAAIRKELINRPGGEGGSPNNDPSLPSEP